MRSRRAQAQPPRREDAAADERVPKLGTSSLTRAMHSALWNRGLRSHAEGNAGKAGRGRPWRARCARDALESTPSCLRCRRGRASTRTRLFDPLRRSRRIEQADCDIGDERLTRRTQQQSRARGRVERLGRLRHHHNRLPRRRQLGQEGAELVSSLAKCGEPNLERGVGHDHSALLPVDRDADTGAIVDAREWAEGDRERHVGDRAHVRVGNRGVD